MPTKSAKPTRNKALAMAVAGDGRFTYAIAAAAGVNPTLFGRIVQGRHEPTPEMKARIARTLGVPEADLFGNGDA
jgi:transcriptional regulator with XRE-family HTH domain